MVYNVCIWLMFIFANNNNNFDNNSIRYNIYIFNKLININIIIIQVCIKNLFYTHIIIGTYICKKQRVTSAIIHTYTYNKVNLIFK